MAPYLFDSPNFVHTVLEELPVGIYIVDREQRIRFWNRGAELATGHPAHEVVGRIFTAHIVGAHDAEGHVVDEQHNPVAMTLSDGQPRQIAAHFLHREGHRIPVAFRCRPIIRSGEAIEGAIVLFEETAGAHGDVAEASLYGCLDAVTGIPSHRLTRALLTESVAGMEESRHGFGLIRVRILGLDEFRSKHGPHSIVPFLHTAAHTLRHNLDATTFLGRWGEDEFIAVLPFTDLMAAAAAAHKIWDLLTSSEVRWWGDRFPIEAVVMHTVAQPGDKLDRLLNGLEPTHAAAAGRAVGMPTGSSQPQGRAAQAGERG
ncbi:MAG TPA: GGDEF domain-containing protein [Terriglobales bacterium]|nr:GGDEF domain-containing protein [Terriglobales bacterium]